MVRVAPAKTPPNRAFACAATSQGHLGDKTHAFTSPTIFGLLEAGRPGAPWVITYDEHGGCYDHVPPPGVAVPPAPSPSSG